MDRSEIVYKIPPQRRTPWGDVDSSRSVGSGETSLCGGRRGSTTPTAFGAACWPGRSATPWAVPQRVAPGTTSGAGSDS